MKILRSLCVLVLAVSASAAFATTPATDHPGSLAILLGVQSVRQELKLDSLQRAVLDSLRGEYKAAARALTTPMPTTPEARVAAEKKLVALNDTFNRRAVSALNRTQRTRLSEIEHQVTGATRLYSPKVQKSLALTGQQKSKIEGIRKSGLAYVAKINRQFEEGKIGFHDRLGLLRDRRLDQGEAMLKLLTPEQRQAYQALGGKKIAI